MLQGFEKADKSWGKLIKSVIEIEKQMLNFEYETYDAVFVLASLYMHFLNLNVD